MWKIERTILEILEFFVLIFLEFSFLPLCLNILLYVTFS